MGDRYDLCAFYVIYLLPVDIDLIPVCRIQPPLLHIQSAVIAKITSTSEPGILSAVDGKLTPLRQPTSILERLDVEH